MPKHSDLLECFKSVQILNISLLEERLWTSSGYKASQLLRKSGNHAPNWLNFVFLLGGLADYAWRAVFRVPVRRTEKNLQVCISHCFYCGHLWGKEEANDSLLIYQWCKSNVLLATKSLLTPLTFAPLIWTIDSCLHSIPDLQMTPTPRITSLPGQLTTYCGTQWVLVQ